MQHLFGISEIRRTRLRSKRRWNTSFSLPSLGVRLEETLEMNLVLFEWRMDRTKPVLTQTYLAVVHRADGGKIYDHFAQLVTYGTPLFISFIFLEIVLLNFGL